MNLIAIHDSDSDHLKNKTFPNYALMKISAYHKSKGDNVEWWYPLKNYTTVYSSKIFDFTEENPYLPVDTIKGGTGYNIQKKLPTYIDDMFPDYSIYPKCDYSIGFITRGCIRNCKWCIVPKKEGSIKPYRNWKDLIRKDTNKLKLLDNNILASNYGISQLSQMIGKNIRIDLNQGMDARLVTNEIAEILSKLKWIKYLRFSCDTKSQIESILRTCELLKKYDISYYKIFIYLLVTKDLNDADFRVQELKKLKGITIYAQAEQNPNLGVIPNKAQKEFAHRYIYGRTYKKETWQQYCKRKNLIFNNELVR